MYVLCTILHTVQNLNHTEPELKYTEMLLFFIVVLPAQSLNGHIIFLSKCHTAYAP